MSKRTISLPDALSQQLDDLAAAQKLPVSQVIQHALEAYFKQPTAPVPASPPPMSALAPELSSYAEILDYLAACAFQGERLRQTVCALCDATESIGFNGPKAPDAVWPPDVLKDRLHWEKDGEHFAGSPPGKKHHQGKRQSHSRARRKLGRKH